MSSKKSFSKENLDNYLRLLGKEYRKQCGSKMPAEIILVGGSSIVTHYGFRDRTYDIDAIIKAPSAMKDAIKNVGNECELPVDWINSDVTKTSSYSEKLVEKSKYYKTFSNILQVRTVSGKYLVAMKLMSGRVYKNDLSDIVGIVYEEIQKGSNITIEDIDEAVCDLYGGWENIPKSSKEVINSIFSSNNLEQLFHKLCLKERNNKEMLKQFEKKYPNILKGSNIEEILQRIEHKKNRDAR